MSITRNPVGWFEVYVSDMARASAFYETVLNIHMQPMPIPDDMEGGFEMLMFPSDMENQAPGSDRHTLG